MTLTIVLICAAINALLWIFPADGRLASAAFFASYFVGMTCLYAMFLWRN